VSEGQGPPARRKSVATVSIVVGIAVAAVASQVLADNNPAPNPATGQVTFGFDKAPPQALVKQGIPIDHVNDNSTGYQDATPWTVLSVPIWKTDPVTGLPVGTLDSGEALRIRTVAAMSRCNDADVNNNAGGGEINSPCERLQGTSYQVDASNPGGYNPYIAARTFLATSDGATVGHNFDTWQTEHCTQEKHHCQIVFTTDITRDDLSHISGLGNYLFINMKVAAWSQDASKVTTTDGLPRDRVELEADCLGDDFGNCPPYHDRLEDLSGANQLSVIRLGPDRGDQDDWTSSKTNTNRLPGRLNVSTEDCNRSDRHNPPNKCYVPPTPPDTTGTFLQDCTATLNTNCTPHPISLVSTQLDGLHANDVIDVPEASITVQDWLGDTYNFNHLVEGRILLTSDGPDAWHVMRSGDRYLSPKGGENCNDGSPSCPQTVVTKVGAATVPSGHPTMWVNYIGDAVDLFGVAGGSVPKNILVPQVTMTVTCRSATEQQPPQPCTLTNMN
jgi:hypothetical protein